MGARLLRANILQLSTKRSKVLARYDAVEDLSTKGEMFLSVRQGLYTLTIVPSAVDVLQRSKASLMPTRF